MPEWKPEIRRRLAGLPLAPVRENAIVEELSQYLDDCYEELLSGGATEAEAYQQALAELSESELLARELRRVERQVALEPIVLGTNRRTKMIADLWQDLRFGARMLWKNPRLTAIVALSLTLGIGANTAIFSLIDALLLRTLPVAEPQRLVLFTIAGQRGNDDSFSYPLYQQFSDQQRSFAGVLASAGVGPVRMVTSEPGDGGQIETAQAQAVSGSFFTVLKVNAALGRTLLAEDDRTGNSQAVAVISYGFWQRRFGGASVIVSRQITLNDAPFTIIGVAPQKFFGIEVGSNPDLWFPLQMIPQVNPGSQALSQRGSWWLRVMGRLKPEVELRQARAEMDLVLKQMLTEMAAARGDRFTPTERRDFLERSIELQPGGAGRTPLRQRFRQPLLILMIAVGLVLAVACANVANLLLARAAARQKEIAVRLSLGANRFRLIRQLLTESALVACLGGALGLLFAWWSARLLLAFLGNSVALNLDLDAHVLGFTLGVSLAVGLLAGLAPALRATRLDLTSSLKEQGGQARPGQSRLSLNKILVVAQVALSLFLLIGAGLFVRSLRNLKNLDAGFKRENVVLFSLDPGRGYDAARRVNLHRQLLARLEALPGVQSASMSNFGLLSDNNFTDKVTVEGYTPQPDEDMVCSGMVVGPRFFETMGIPLQFGRDFSPQDEQPPATAQTANQAEARGAGNAARSMPRVAMVNQAMARYFFGNANPLGKHFSLPAPPDKPPEPIEIIGVVKDTKYRDLREPSHRIFYLPSFGRLGSLGMTFELRTSVEPSGFGAALRRVVQELDPKVQVVNLRTLNDEVNGTLVRERFIAQLAGFFGLFALLLASMGLYGVMSYATTRRTNEIGIRMALGAQSLDVIRLVMREMMLLVMAGVTIGLGAALAATRIVTGLLFGLTGTDPLTIILAVLVMLTTALLACWIPARRATKVDPIIALRVE